MITHSARNGMKKFISLAFGSTTLNRPPRRKGEVVEPAGSGRSCRWRALASAASVALCFSLQATIAAADPVVIASARIEGGFIFGGGGFQPGLLGRFLFQAPEAIDPPENNVFNVTVTSADVGRTFRATPATDPAFAATATALTDGRDQFVAHALAFDDGLWAKEALFESALFKRTLGQPPDLTGFLLTALTFRLDRLTVLDDQRNQSRSVDYAGLLTFEGAANNAPVPEPGTLLLFASGAAIVGRRAWKASPGR